MAGLRDQHLRLERMATEAEDVAFTELARAWELELTGHGEDAAAAYGAAVRACDLMTSWFLAHRGEFRYNQGDYPAALDDFQNALISAPKVTFLACRVFACHVRMGDLERGKQALSEFARNNPGNDEGQVAEVAALAGVEPVSSGVDGLQHLGIHAQARASYCIIERMLAAGLVREATPVIRQALSLHAEPETTLRRWRSVRHQGHVSTSDN